MRRPGWLAKPCRKGSRTTGRETDSPFQGPGGIPRAMWGRNRQVAMPVRHQHTSHAAAAALESRRGRRFVFLHIPKTAGSTIHHRVLRRSPYFIDVGLDSPQPHFTYRELAQQLSPQTLERYWTFCFIRHPVDRYLSRIRYLQRPDSAEIARHKEEWQLANTVTCPKQILRIALRECPAFWRPGTAGHRPASSLMTLSGSARTLLA